jgi:exodeoxyribonuclease VII large subunit
MNQKLLYRLKTWRVMQAQKEGTDLFRVLPNTALEEIARVLPKTAEEFLNIKGIKEGRWNKYGAMLMAMVGDYVASDEEVETVSTQKTIQHTANDTREHVDIETAPEIPGQRTLYTVSAFLEALNILFAEMTVRVKGEISSVDTRGSATYFTLKDSQDGSILSCLIFRYQYEVSGVKLEVGQEIIVEGVPGIWKPTGRLSLKAQSLEVSGVGALQKAYDDLKQKLNKEGIFSPEKKRIITEFPERIALITSNQGAAIGDFLMNLGKWGFKISLLNVNVEGKKAVFDLIEAVRFFNRTPEKYDVLVIIRGGGSLESLQAFNNEALVREVAQSRIPTLCGIGHEKDVSLTAMAGDVMVSTPTATARFLRESFEKADVLLLRYEQRVTESFRKMLHIAYMRCEDSSHILIHQLQNVKDRYFRVRNDFLRSVEKMHFSIQNKHSTLTQLHKVMMSTYALRLESVQEKIQQSETKLVMNDPKRLLRLGYSLVMKNDKLVRSVADVQTGDTLSITLVDGSARAEVTNV